MPTSEPTILATSGGLRPGSNTALELSELSTFAVDLAGVSGRAPKVCFLATALGDNEAALLRLHDAARVAGWQGGSRLMRSCSRARTSLTCGLTCSTRTSSG